MVQRSSMGVPSIGSPKTQSAATSRGRLGSRPAAKRNTARTRPVRNRSVRIRSSLLCDSSSISAPALPRITALDPGRIASAISSARLKARPGSRSEVRSAMTRRPELSPSVTCHPWAASLRRNARASGEPPWSGIASWARSQPPTTAGMPAASSPTPGNASVIVTSSSGSHSASASATRATSPTAAGSICAAIAGVPPCSAVMPCATTPNVPLPDRRRRTSNADPGLSTASSINVTKPATWRACWPRSLTSERR